VIFLTERKKKLGIWVGYGPVPDNIITDVAIDMKGKDIGLFVSMSDPIEKAFRQAIDENPLAAEEL